MKKKSFLENLKSDIAEAMIFLYVVSILGALLLAVYSFYDLLKEIVGAFSVVG